MIHLVAALFVFDMSWWLWVCHVFYCVCPGLTEAWASALLALHMVVVHETGLCLLLHMHSQPWFVGKVGNTEVS